MSTQPHAADTYIVTPDVRLQYPALWVPKPRAADKPDALTFQAVLLIPPDADLAPFANAIRAAVHGRFGPTAKINPAKLPIRSCADKPDSPGYDEGWHYLNVHSKRQPGVVDQLAVPIATDDGRVYAGCWVRAYINAFAWEHPVGGRGVSFGLNAVQLVRDGERLVGGGRPATEVFAPLADFKPPAATPQKAAPKGAFDDLF